MRNLARLTFQSVLFRLHGWGLFLVCPDCYALNIYEREVIPFDGLLLPTEYLYVCPTMEVILLTFA